MVLNWTNEDGKRERQSISTGLPAKGNKTRAKEMLDDARKQKRGELEAQLAIRPNKNDMLFADYLELWVEAIKQNIALTTYGTYATNIRRIIAPYFRKKGIKLSDLTPQHLNEFYNEQKKRVKILTVQKYHANISNALNYAVENDLAEYSIIGTGKVRRPAVPKNQRFVGKFLKMSEAVELFDKIRGHKLELGVILGAYYGLRRSEIVGLRWESIDFDANSITIEHTVTETRIDGKRVIIEGDSTKSEKSLRALPLTPAFRQKLISIREDQEHNRKLCGRSYNVREGKYVYPDRLHAHLDAGSKVASAGAMKWLNDTQMAQEIVMGKCPTACE